jgi:hypothetical protein
MSNTKSVHAANIVYRSGHISISEIWTADNLYVIQDNLTVDQGVGLTIEPGTIVKFAENKLLGVYGILRIGTVGGAYYSNYLPLALKVNRSARAHSLQSGTINVSDEITQDEVIITSLRDDIAGGDTNGDGNATAPDAGDWGHIVFFDSSVDAVNLIQNAVIRYGGYFHNHYNDYYECWNCEYLGLI